MLGGVECPCLEGSQDDLAIGDSCPGSLEMRSLGFCRRQSCLFHFSPSSQKKPLSARSLKTSRELPTSFAMSSRVSIARRRWDRCLAAWQVEGFQVQPFQGRNRRQK